MQHLNLVSSVLLVLAVLCSGGRVENEECRRHNECPDSMLCMSHQCGDPCEGMECGVNSNCVTSNHINTACQCKPGFHKVDPSNETAGCTECSAHSHCPGSNMCVLEHCIDLCEHNVCGDNSTCNIDNNKLSCNGIEVQARVNATDLKQQCSAHSHCPGSNMCVLEHCIDLCQHNVCGANSTCNIDNNKLSCNGIEVQAINNATDLKQQCSAHSHCPGSNMCVLEHCIDLCQHNVCGDNSTCNIDNNKLSCNGIEVQARVNATDFVSKEQRPRVWSAEQSVDIRFKDGARGDGWVQEARFSVETRDVEVELTRLKCSVLGGVDFTLRIHITSQSDTFTLTHSAHTSAWDYIPVSTRDKPVVLSPHTLYNITLSCDAEFYLYTLPSPRYTEPHFHLQFPPYRSGRYGSSVYEIFYKSHNF